MQNANNIYHANVTWIMNRQYRKWNIFNIHRNCTADYMLIQVYKAIITFDLIPC